MKVSVGIKTLIFDLGGVILDLSVEHTVQAFSLLSGMPHNLIREIFHSSSIFTQYEKGELTDEEFRNEVRSLYSLHAPDEEIDKCWNAMLRGIPESKLQLLLRLKNQYQVLLLSNTNNIHLSHIQEQILPVGNGRATLEPYFHRTYYSHLMNKRKPDADIFEEVLAENNLTATNTLFLDDNEHNIAGAAALGIQTFYVKHPDLIIELFS